MGKLLLHLITTGNKQLFCRKLHKSVSLLTPNHSDKPHTGHQHLEEYIFSLDEWFSGLPWCAAVKNPAAVQDTGFRSLGLKDPLEEGVATHSSILPWRIPWTEEPGGLQSIGL